MRLTSATILLTALTVAIGKAHADAPELISYQGMLTDAESGAPLEGTVELTFTMFPDAQSGSAMWSETHPAVPVSAGVFSVILGSLSPLDAASFDDVDVWIETAVDGAPVIPRRRLTSVPYALHSARAEWYTGPTLHVSSTVVNQGSGQLRMQVTEPTSSGHRFLEVAKRHSTDQGRSEWVFDLTAPDTPDLRFWRVARFDSTPTDWGDLNQLVLAWDGNVGIGTPAPSQRLEVNGAVDADAFLINGVPIDPGSGGLWNAVGNGNIEYSGDILIGEEGGGDSDSEALVIRAESDRWYVGVQNEASTSSTDFFIGKAGLEDGTFHITNDGSVGIGTTNPAAKLDVNGTLRADVLELLGSDLAEPFPISASEVLEPGTVVVIDETNPGKLTPSLLSYDRKVAGVVSGARNVSAGLILMDPNLPEGQDIALVGRVYVKTTAQNGPIRPGDLLTTSAIPGHAMLSTETDRSQGAILGKAMTSLEQGEGLILALINLQ